MTRPKNISDEDWRERRREEYKKYYANRTEEQKEHRRAYARAYVANITEEQRERKRVASRAWWEANPDKRRKYRKPRTEAEKLARKPMTPEQRVAKKAYDLAYVARLTDDERAKRKTRAATRRAQNGEVIRAKSQAERDSLSDAYVKHLLRNLGFVNPPQELIELKRVQLKIRRYLNQ